MIDAARRLEKGGADGLAICTNTMHKLAAEVQNAVAIPVLHIAEATAAAVKQTGVSAPLLLVTRYTMEQDFYRSRLLELGVETRTPDAEGRTIVHDMIYHELCQGVIDPQSKQRYLAVVRRAQDAGADGVIFGCTEIGLLLSRDERDVPVFDTTELHAAAALDFALS